MAIDHQAIEAHRRMLSQVRAAKVTKSSEDTYAAREQRRMEAVRACQRLRAKST